MLHFAGNLIPVTNVRQKEADIEEGFIRGSVDVLADSSKTFGEKVKEIIKKVIDIQVQQEVAKALISAPLSFGATLAAIGPILAAGAIGKAAVDAIPLQQGGIVTGETLLGGGRFKAGEAGAEANKRSARGGLH